MSDISWFVLLICLAVIVFLYSKLTSRIDQLQNNITELKTEVLRQKNRLRQFQSSHTATNTVVAPLDEDNAQNDLTADATDSAANSDNQAAVQASATETNIAHANTPIAPVAASTSDIQFVNKTKSRPQLHPKVRSAPAIEPDEQSFPIVTSLFHSLKNWFFGGNLVVRVGVIVLLIGVVLLLRLLSDYIEVSIESKLIAIGVIGLSLAALGLKLAKNRFAYGITLQGAGLAIAYLTTFFAYSVYYVLPSLPSFIGLGLLSAITIGLAVRQNAFPLALLALSGGFFAPILTASDTGSLTALFSYYLLLNVTIAIIAHYRTWKVLNAFGALVTFALAYYWGISEDLAWVIESQRWSLVGLVALHLALYLFVVIRYAQQIIAYNSANEANTYPLNSEVIQTSKSTSSLYVFPIDTGLLFSIPLLAFGLFSALLDDIPNALTLTSAILAAVYLGLGLFFVKRSQHYALITEGMLALGFGFLALVIPLALDAEWIAFGWSVQGLALVWFGRRSLRAWSVLLGLLLQVISIVILIVTLFLSLSDYPSLAMSLSALALLATVFILRTSNSPMANQLPDSAITISQTNSQTGQDRIDAITTATKDLGMSDLSTHQWFNSIDKQGNAFSMVWRSPDFIMFVTLVAMVWALYVGIADFEHWFDHQQVATTTLIALSALLSFSLYWSVDRYRSWHEMRLLSHILLVVFYIALVLQLPQKFEFDRQWNSVNWTLFAILIIGWLVVGQLWLKTWYHHKQLSRFDSALWLGTGVLVLAAAVHYGLPDSQGVMTILLPIALMVLGLYFGYRYDQSKPINAADAPKNSHSSDQQGLAYWFDGYQALIDCAKIFVPYSLLWVIVTNWFYDGVVWNLAYFPLINLYDLSLWLVVIYGLGVVYISQKNAQNTTETPVNYKDSTTKPFLVILGLISFWIISSMLVRSLHAFVGTPLWSYRPLGAWSSEQVQTGLTILWTLIALVATIISSRQLKRTPWFMGIGLLGVVVLKLVLVDLSQTEAIWRVVSFLVAGSLILLIGYLAPLPPEEREKVDEVKEEEK